MDNRSAYQSEEFAKAWHKRHNKEDLFKIKIINPILLSRIGDLSDKVLLDAGCGDGPLLRNLLELKPKETCAFDISAPLIEIAKKDYPSVRFVVADLLKRLPYEDGSFDVISCCNVLMNVPDLEAAVKELSRVIKKEGYMHVFVVHPVHNLFVDDKKAQDETLKQRLRRYTKSEHLFVNTMPDFDQFIIFRRPISAYINTFIDEGFSIEEMLELPISAEVMEADKKYEGLIGSPVFAYFKLRKK